MRLSTKIILALIALLVLWAISPYYNKYKSEQLIEVSIAGNHFRIPYKYFDSGPFARMGMAEKKQGSMLLSIRWPDMATRQDLGAQGFRDAQLVEQRIGGILVQDAKKLISFEQSIYNRQSNETAKYKKNPSQFGLESFSITTGGLGGPQSFWTRDYFVERDQQGQIITLVECYPEVPERYPVCSDQFNYLGMRLGVSYNRKNFLADWRSQRARALDLLEQFRINTPLTKQGE